MQRKAPKEKCTLEEYIKDKQEGNKGRAQRKQKKTNTSEPQRITI